MDYRMHASRKGKVNEFLRILSFTRDPWCLQRQRTSGKLVSSRRAEYRPCFPSQGETELPAHLGACSMGMEGLSPSSHGASNQGSPTSLSSHSNRKGDLWGIQETIIRFNKDSYRELMDYSMLGNEFLHPSTLYSNSISADGCSWNSLKYLGKSPSYYSAKIFKPKELGCSLSKIIMIWVL